MQKIKEALRSIPVTEAVNCILCHDITEIVPGQNKGPIFRKGHIITADDVPVLLRVGKEHIYVYEPNPAILHENDAALRIATALCGSGLHFSDISEGRINFLANTQGLLRINTEKLLEINCLPEIAVATIHSMQEVKIDQAIGGTRIIPLLIEEHKIRTLEELLPEPIIEVLPLRKPCVGIVTTGSEIYHGRIKDSFGPVLTKKITHYEGTILGQSFTSDDVQMTKNAIEEYIEKGADIVMVTGGMSVDPDDKTPAAIAKTGAHIISYGTPIFPGAMFLLAKLGNTHILGLPGCVMYHKASIFEIIMPRILAGIDVCQKDLAALGHGGFCASCNNCHYPACAFGK